MDKNFNKGEIVIYTSEDGKITLDTKLENDTIWLTQKQMAELFGVKTPAINKHLNNIYKKQELNKNATISKMEIVQKEGNRKVLREVTFYNLDAIISVGYRVNSSRATQFRIWSNSVLKEYLTKGYAINENKLLQDQEKVKTLQDTISLLSRSLTNQIQTIDEAQVVAKILNDFACGLDLLDNFDHKTLDEKGVTQKETIRITTEEFLQIVKQMKSKFASDVFGNPKDESFDSSINQIYQTFDGKELYPTLEEKAAMLLYLIKKITHFLMAIKGLLLVASCIFLKRTERYIRQVFQLLTMQHYLL